MDADITYSYGDLQPAQAKALGSLVYSNLGCTTLACLRSASIGDILDAETNAYLAATSDPTASTFVPGVSAAEPYRPTIDGTYVKGQFLDLINGKNGGLVSSTITIYDSGSYL